MVAFLHGAQRAHRGGEGLLYRVLLREPGAGRPRARLWPTTGKQGGRRQALLRDGQGRLLGQGRPPAAPLLRLGSGGHGQGPAVLRDLRQLPRDRDDDLRERGGRAGGCGGAPRMDERCGLDGLGARYRQADRLQRGPRREQTPARRGVVRDVLACGGHQDRLQGLGRARRRALRGRPRDLLRLCGQELGCRLHVALVMARVEQPDQRRHRQAAQQLRARDRWWAPQGGRGRLGPQAARLPEL